jgi:precorrin-2 dehydrogenase/sirohydrochlorin ferrochelatase
MLDVSERLVVVIGGGGVAARKVQGLLDAGANRVRCVALEFAQEFSVAPAVERIKAAYDPQFLAGAALVFAATDNAQTNAAIVRDAHRLGVLVNRADADDEAPGDFSTPAVLRGEDFLITVSASGAPALAAMVRDGIRDRLDPRWTAMARAMQVLRPRITGRGDLPIASRRSALRDLASEEAMEILDRRGVEELWAWVRRKNQDL